MLHIVICHFSTFMYKNSAVFRAPQHAHLWVHSLQWAANEWNIFLKLNHSVSAYTVLKAMRQVHGGGSFWGPWGSETPEPIQLKFGSFNNVHHPTLHAKQGRIQGGGGGGSMPPRR